MKQSSPAARINPGTEIRHAKRWHRVSGITLDATHTTIALDSGERIKHKHNAQVTWRYAETAPQTHYAPTMTRVNQDDSDNGVDLMRHK